VIRISYDIGEAKKQMTLTQILDYWNELGRADPVGTPAKITRGASDSEVLAFAAFATILLGQRAQARGRTDVEMACKEFMAFLNAERKNTTHKTYRLKKQKDQLQ
jgi:hypothetical protein